MTIFNFNFDKIVFAFLMIVLFGLALILIACGLDYMFNVFYRISKSMLTTSKWVKIKAKIKGFDGVSNSYKVVYMVENTKYMVHIIDPEISSQGKYVYLYYKKANPQKFKTLKRQTRKNLIPAIFCCIIGLVCIMLGIFFIGNFYE